MFLIGEGENFSMVFSRDVAEYQKSEKERKDKEAKQGKDGKPEEISKGETENKENLQTGKTCKHLISAHGYLLKKTYLH